jgi:hypothetical protein
MQGMAILALVVVAAAGPVLVRGLMEFAKFVSESKKSTKHIAYK